MEQSMEYNSFKKFKAIASAPHTAIVNLDMGIYF